jgi:hypothetical protein
MPSIRSMGPSRNCRLPVYCGGIWSLSRIGPVARQSWRGNMNRPSQCSGMTVCGHDGFLCSAITVDQWLRLQPPGCWHKRLLPSRWRHVTGRFSPTCDVRPGNASSPSDFYASSARLLGLRPSEFALQGQQQIIPGQRPESPGRSVQIRKSPASMVVAPHGLVLAHEGFAQRHLRYVT